MLSFVLLLVAFTLVACTKVSVTVTGANVLTVGETITLTPEAKGKNVELSWASSNPAVATVQDGKVTGVGTHEELLVTNEHYALESHLQELEKEANK